MKTYGTLLKTKQGLEVPREVINGRDRIVIELENRERKEFLLYVSEEELDSGGGKLGEILDSINQDRNSKPYPCLRYDPELNADIYRIKIMDLILAWTIYTGKDKRPITDKQRQARRNNMAIARKARKITK